MRRLIYVSDAYPVLSQTFTLREVRDLHAAGLPVTVVSLRPPGADDPEPDPEADPPLWQAPSPFSVEVLGAVTACKLTRPWAWATTMSRALLPHTHPFWPKMQLRSPLHVAWGAWLARRLRGLGPLHLHAQFVWGASTVAWAASRLSGASYSFTSHSDFGLPLVKSKLRQARGVLAISDYEKRRLLSFAPDVPADRIRVHRLGVELPEAVSETPRKPGPVRMLAVGTFGPKKGHDVLLRACGLLRDAGHEFRLDLVGEGPLRPELEALHRELRLGGLVELLGSRPHAEVLELTEDADLVVLACRVTERGDHDGIPVSLMEGMARGKPAVSTAVSGIPELIEDGDGGRLVAPEQPEALAEALGGLIADEGLRTRLGRSARARVERLHEAEASARESVHLFTQLLADD
jgi:glycosyltransferase involved in cell wall biosynthesis